MDKYYTFYEYMRNSNLTASEEDYIEMIYRLSLGNSEGIRVIDLANALNVTPPSVSKMIKKLSEKELLTSKKYGAIYLNELGISIGRALLERHNIVKSFLIILGLSTDLLEETEKIEHTLNEEALFCIKNLVNFFNENEDILDKLRMYKNTTELK